MSKSLQPNSKSGFIRENLDLTNEQIITKGKGFGHEIKPNLIYMVRSQAKNGAPKRKMKKVRASALRKKAPRAKRKYTRRIPVVHASNGKTPVSVSALVERFKADLAAINQQTLKDALEGLL